MSHRGLGQANMEALGASESCRGTVSPGSPDGSSVRTARPLASSAATVDEVDAARGREYALLSVLLARAPERSLLERLAGLRGDASPLGAAHAALAEAAGRTSVERVEREYFDL